MPDLAHQCLAHSKTTRELTIIGWVYLTHFLENILHNVNASKRNRSQDTFAFQVNRKTRWYFHVCRHRCYKQNVMKWWSIVMQLPLCQEPRSIEWHDKKTVDLEVIVWKHVPRSKTKVRSRSSNISKKVLAIWNRRREEFGIYFDLAHQRPYSVFSGEL